VITSIEFTGDGAADFDLDGEVSTPIQIMDGATLSLCVKTVNEGTSSATMVVTTTAGTFSTQLVREITSSVDEFDPTVITGLTVAPNPAKDEVRIATPIGTTLQVRVYNAMGSAVQTLSGPGEILWDGRDASGTRVAPGMYVLVIDQGLRTQIVKLLVE